MSWRDLEPELRALAVEALTAKQLDAWKLELAGYGARTIGQMLDLSKTAVTDRLAAAHRRLERAGVCQDGSGRWYIQEVA